MFDGDKKENEEEANRNVWYIIYNIHVKMLAIYQTYWVIGESKKSRIFVNGKCCKPKKIDRRY